MLYSVSQFLLKNIRYLSMERFLLIKEFLMFLKERKKFWLIPIVVVFLAVGMLLVAAQGSVVAPFIYTLF